MKKIIYTENAPKAVGPYNQAVLVNDTLYVSGQIPLNPETGEVVGDTIKQQTEQVLRNVGEILKAAGMDYTNVVKSTCILKNLADFKEMNEVYARFYSENSPARAAFGNVDLPFGVLIEIETIAVK